MYTINEMLVILNRNKSKYPILAQASLKLHALIDCKTEEERDHILPGLRRELLGILKEHKIYPRKDARDSEYNDKEVLATYIHLLLLTLAEAMPINSTEPFTQEEFKNIPRLNQILFSTGHGFHFPSLLKHACDFQDDAVYIQDAHKLNILTREPLNDFDIQIIDMKLTLADNIGRKLANEVPPSEDDNQDESSAMEAFHKKVSEIFVDLVLSAPKPINIYVFTELVETMGIDVNAVDKEGYTLLMRTAITGDAQLFEFLLARRANVDHQAPDQMTAWQLASLYDRQACLSLLTESHADNTESRAFQPLKRRLSLFDRIGRGDVAIVSDFLDSTPDFNAKQADHLQNTAIKLSLKHDHPLIFEKMLQFCSFDIELALLAIQHGALKCLKLMVNKNLLNGNFSCSNGYTLVYEATWYNQVSCLQFLLTVPGMPIDALFKGLSPSYIAVQNNHPECLRYLLENGANINLHHQYGVSLVYKAAANNSVECLRLLISRGADVNKMTDDGCMPVYKAASAGHTKCLALLILAGAKMDVMFSRYYPLHIAVKYGHLDCVKLLLKAGFDASTPLPDGSCIEDIARDFKQNECLVFINTYDGNPDQLPDIGSYLPEAVTTDDANDLTPARAAFCGATA